MARGCVDFKTKQPQTTYPGQPEYRELPDALNNWLDQELDGHFLVIKDACPALRDNPLAVAKLKALANRIVYRDDTYATVFLVGSQPIVPPELEKFITIFELLTARGGRVSGSLIHEHGRGRVEDDRVVRRGWLQHFAA